MKKYEVKVKFIFEGTFVVNAKTREEARDKIDKHCGLVMGGNIHTTLDEKDVDWDFGIHPETQIIAMKQIRNKNNNL